MGIYVSIHISQGWQFVFCSLSYSLPASGASLPKFLARGQSNVLAKAIGSIIPLNLPDMGGIPTIKIWVYLFALPTLRLFFGGRLDLDFSAIINDLDINVHETRFNHEDLSLLGVMCVFASRKLALNMWKLDTDMRAISTGTECIYTKGRQLYSWRYWSKVFSDFFGGWRCQLPESCFTWWRYSWLICWWCWSLNSGGVLAGEFKWFIALHPWVMMIPYNQADQICNDIAGSKSME